MTAPSQDFLRYRFLMSTMSLNALKAMVRQICVPEDAANLTAITRAWRIASEKMADLSQSEAGLADGISLADPPASVLPRLEELRQGHLFRETFSAVPAVFKVVEIDKLIAPQREVHLDYVDDLRKRIPGKKVEDLLEFCLAPATETAEVKTLQSGPNQVTFCSRSPDLRFLGGVSKPLSEADLAVSPSGQPVETMTLFVGFGAAPLNAYMAGNRVVLANGFHRVAALRGEGVTHVPMVVQKAVKVELDFPEQIMAQPRAYLLQSPRPVLIKDFFDDDLTVELRLKPRKKAVKVVWRVEETFIPE